MTSDFCEVIIKGQLDVDWSGWFEGLAIAHHLEDETMLSGQIRDQAAFYGLIAKIRDMGLFLLSVKYTVGECTEEFSAGISATGDDPAFE